MCRNISRNIPVDDRHHIRKPIDRNKSNEEKIMDMEIFAKTLMNTRIPTLFLTERGLPGHIIQIRNELSRLNELFKLEDANPILFEKAVLISKLLRSSLIKARDAARKNGFPVWGYANTFFAAP